MPDQIIKIADVEKKFESYEVLSGVTFVLNKYENLVIIGKSGSGKSVLLKIIIGLLAPDSGRVEVMGNDIWKLKEQDLMQLRKKLGYLFQDGALYDAMTVRQNLEFSLKRQINRKRDDEIEALVRQVLSKVGLLNTIDKMPDQLSGGMKKRVALARTLMLEPEIILFDEPTTGLDPVTSKEISELILEMRNEFGITSVIVTHDIQCAKIAGDRLLTLNDGKVSERKLTDLKNSDEAWLRAFLE